jgi:hypothetical protein
VKGGNGSLYGTTSPEGETLSGMGFTTLYNLSRRSVISSGLFTTNSDRANPQAGLILPEARGQVLHFLAENDVVRPGQLGNGRLPNWAEGGVFTKN